jgi:flagellar hook-associated protein 3 FlgL
MRVTEQMVVSDYLRNITKTRESLDELSRQESTNSKVGKPSDDPFAAEAIMRYQSAIDKNSLYQKNANNAVDYLETSFDAVDGTIGALTDFKTLLTASSNTEEPDTLKTYGDEADSILQRLVDYGNTKFNGKYVFAGSNTTTVPYKYDGTSVTVDSKGTGGNIYVDIGGQSLETINTNGNDVFQGTEIFDYIAEVRNKLKNNEKPTNEEIAKIDTYIDSVNVQFGKIGAVTERFQAVQTQLESERDRKSVV